MKFFKRSWVAIAAASAAIGCGGANDNRPENLKATWFGVTNHHYQVGETSFIQDGQVSNYMEGLTAAQAVDKTWAALSKGGATTPSHIFIGHDHTADHSRDTPVWLAKFPQIKVVAPKSQCDRLVELGIKNECLTLTPAMSDGKFAIKLGDSVEIRPVKWTHSNHNVCVTTTATFPTWGYLIRVDTKRGPITVYSHDSGSGDGLDKPVVEDTGTYLAPLTSLANAMQGAGATRMDLWQGGSETRVMKQARQLVPLFKPKAFQPQHWAERNMLQGIPYDWFPGATFTKFLADNGINVVKQQNYFDAVAVDVDGTRRLANPAVKAEIGLPADGTGPSPVGSHPRLVALPSGECPGD